jgi:hypothetical protein
VYRAAGVCLRYHRSEEGEKVVASVRVGLSACRRGCVSEGGLEFALFTTTHDDTISHVAIARLLHGEKSRHSPTGPHPTSLGAGSPTPQAH